MCPALEATASTIMQAPAVVETLGLMEMLKMEFSELVRETLSLRQSWKGRRIVFTLGLFFEKA